MGYAIPEFDVSFPVLVGSGRTTAYALIEGGGGGRVELSVSYPLDSWSSVSYAVAGDPYDIYDEISGDGTCLGIDMPADDFADMLYAAM